MSRIGVNKTYKLYIDGAFPRTESGRYHALTSKDGRLLANVSLASVKDFRNSVSAARSAFRAWHEKSAFLRSQILYRMAEMMEGRRGQFVAELVSVGHEEKNAQADVSASIDRIVHYAGWCDKYQQVFSSVNPVAGPHLNFSVPEPMGVVAIVAPDQSDGSMLLGLCSALAPVLAGGNTCVLLAELPQSLSAVSLAEVIHGSDVPAGVVNILTGSRQELLPVMASHREVNALMLCSDLVDERNLAQVAAADHLMRVIPLPNQAAPTSPYLIQDFQELKTTWQPVGL